MTHPAPTIDAVLDGVSIDSVALADLTITYGRTQVTEQPSPSSLSLSMLTDQVVKVPQVGMIVTVDAVVGVSSYKRFVGTVTSVSAGRYLTSVTATSKGLGRLARVSAPDYLFDASLTGIGENIEQLLAPTGVFDPPKQVVYTYSQGDTTVLPDWRVPAGSVLSQCQTLASYDTAGVFYEKPNGDLVFSDGNDRVFQTGDTPDIYLAVGGFPAESPVVADAWASTQSLDGLTNQAVVTFGAPTQVVKVTDGTSLDQWGEFGVSIEFPVVSASDAIRKASRVVANYSQPRTVANPLVLELTSCAAALQAQLLQAEVGTSFGFTPDAATSGIPGLPEAVFLEGYTERIVGQGGTKGRHTLSVTVSDVALTRTMQTWANVTPLLKWSAVTPTLTWYALAGQDI